MFARARAFLDVKGVFLLSHPQDQVFAILGDIATEDLRAGAVIHRVRAMLRTRQLVEDLRRANRRLRLLARTDELTRVRNRRGLRGALGREFRRASRYGGALSLLLFDIDHFKAVNDTLGHQAGDLQLRMVVLAVQNELRNIDYVGRYGGDEFVLVLTQTPMAGARECADRFRRALEQRSRNEVGAALAVTVSVGIAEYRSKESVTQTVRRADAALYRAKAGGRNRIECAPTSGFAHTAL